MYLNVSKKNSRVREASHIACHFLEDRMTSIGAQLHGQWNNMASINAQRHGKWIVLEHQSGFMEVSETLWDWWKFSTNPKEFPETSEDCIHGVLCNSHTYIKCRFFVFQFFIFLFVNFPILCFFFSLSNFFLFITETCFELQKIDVDF